MTTPPTHADVDKLSEHLLKDGNTRLDKAGIGTLDASFTDGRVTSRIDTAKDYLKEGATKKDPLVLRDEALPDFELKAKRLDDLKESLERTESEEGKKVYKKMVAEAQTELEKDGKKALSNLTAGRAKHLDVIKEAEAAQKKQIASIERALADKEKELFADLKANPARGDAIHKEIAVYRDNVTKARSAIEKHYDELLKPHKAMDERVGEIIADIEKHTGLKAGDHASKAAATASAVGKTGMFERIGNNFKGGGFRTGKAAIGSVAAIGFGVSGAKDVLTGLGVIDPGHNPDGSEKEAGGVLTGGLKIGAAVLAGLAAGHGGHVR